MLSKRLFNWHLGKVESRHLAKKVVSSLVCIYFFEMFSNTTALLREPANWMMLLPFISTYLFLTLKITDKYKMTTLKIGQVTVELSNLIFWFHKHSIFVLCSGKCVQNCTFTCFYTDSSTFAILTFDPQDMSEIKPKRRLLPAERIFFILKGNYHHDIGVKIESCLQLLC